MGDKFEEIIRPKRVTKIEKERCPKCGGALVYGRIGCPGQSPSSMTTCAVYHTGYTCKTCGTQFIKK